MRREVQPARRARIHPIAAVAVMAGLLAGHACVEVCQRAYELSRARPMTRFERVEANVARIRREIAVPALKSRRRR